MRKGVELLLRRQFALLPRSVEKYDMAIMIGNEKNFNTFSEFEFNLSALVPNTGYDLNVEFDNTKNYEFPLFWE